jgi:hypothetical protein
MTRFGHTLTFLVGASLGVAACTNSIDEPTTDTPDPGSTAGGEGNTFDHDNEQISVWDLIKRLTQEGPPSFTSHMHSCSKLRYATLGNVLTSVGVNVASTTALSAGQLYRDGASALGTANFANRLRENIGVTTSGSSRTFDIFAAAAPEIITNLPNLARCQVGGVTPGPALFDTSNKCNIDAISCLIGAPATQAHVDICNVSVTNASDPNIGKRLAVAALLAAAYTCE